MTPKIVIADGPDNVGKSLIAKMLAEHYGCKVNHFGKPDKGLELINPLYQYEFLFDQILSSEVPEYTVLDRSWYSGIFYKLMRRQDSADLNLFRGFERALKDHYNLHVFYIYRPWHKAVGHHALEIANEEGFGSINTRLIEHISWLSYYNNLNYFSKGLLSMEPVDNSEDGKAENAAKHIITRVEGAGQAMVLPHDPQSENHYFFSLWDKQLRPYPKYSRNI